MTFLPLAGSPGLVQAGDMSSRDRPIRTARRGAGPATARAGQALGRAAHAVAAVFAECHYAQARLLQLRMNPDRYVIGGGQAPDNYAEFLFRTSGPLRHEPSADKRFAAGPGRR
jgi:hypothetical protein